MTTGSPERSAVSPPPPDSLPPAADLGKSEYLSAERLVDDLRRGDDVFAAALDVGRRRLASVDRVLLVGSGGSGACLLTAQYLLDRLSTIPVQVVTGNDLAWRRPLGLDERTLVVLTSFSGTTADVVDALTLVAASGAPTLTITGRADSRLADFADELLVYPGSAIFEYPVLLLLAMFGADRRSRAAADLAEAARATLPDVLETVLPTAIRETAAMAQQVASVDHLYVTGAGPLASLAFKLAPVMMENVRIGATYYDTSEMRHGPLEFLDTYQPPLLALLGTDESRAVAAGVIGFWRQRGGQVLTLDAAELPPVDPLLTPLLLNPISQWFVAWSAAHRGIVDLDERVYMGKGLFSAGSWP